MPKKAPQKVARAVVGGYKKRSAGKRTLLVAASSEHAKAIERALKKSRAKKPSSRRELDVIQEFQILGSELSARLYAVAEKRGVLFPDLLREAVQKFLEQEIVEPTTEAADDALYPPTDSPLQEAPVVRAGEVKPAEPVLDWSDGSGTANARPIEVGEE